MVKKTTSIALATTVMAVLVGTGIWRVGGAALGPSDRADLDIPVDEASISGVVLNEGETPEAGVWVIAETRSLPTHFLRIVVTDDRGRFLVPDLPEGSYEVWVRGYGVRDSAPVSASRGQRLTLRVKAPGTLQEAAKVYPANYWLSLLEPPAAAELGEEYVSRDHWVSEFKLRCFFCHQIGSEITRLWTRPDDFEVIWKRAKLMSTHADQLGREVLKQTLSSWASRIQAGDVPQAPPRPANVERNVVVTLWEWGTKESYMHDEVSTDKRNPTLYPYGKVWGVDFGQDRLYALDPVKHTVASWKIPTRNLWAPPADGPDDWAVLNNPANPHNPMMDDKGNVWITVTTRPGTEKPEWSRQVIADADRAAAEKWFFDRPGGRSLSYFDPKRERFIQIDTVARTHHLQFDAQGRLWTSGNGPELGMFDPRQFDPQNADATIARAQKAWMGIDPKTGKPGDLLGYGIIVNPVDGTIWRASPRGGGAVNNINKFDPKTGTFSNYPLTPPGRGPRGIDASTDGKLWFATASGHVGRFDPTTKRFRYWETPGPKLKDTGAETGSADFHYYLWVDQFNTLGLGKDIVMVNGTNSDAILAFDPTTERWTVLRVPYPLGFYQRGLDGRIDDANAGWKGRGLWADYGGDPIMFTEKTQIGYAVHMQVRPDPLAR